MEPPQKHSALQRLQAVIMDQDNTQKITASISGTLELYRVLVSSLLILFVPQSCNGHVCTLQENMESDSNMYTAGIVINFVTMFAFMTLYSVEIRRENKLIAYLEVNRSQPTDNHSVGQALQRIPEEKRNNILTLDKHYQRSAYFAMVFFVVNAILSGIIVYNYSLGNQTTTTIITNIIFMVMKLVDVHAIVNTEENIFYSAYLKGKVQFNDVDPDKQTPVIEIQPVNQV